MGDQMIEIFKSPSGKRIVAINEESGIVCHMVPGGILLAGTDESIGQLRIALNSERDGWDKEAIDACKIKLPPLTDEQKAEILKSHANGFKPRDIAHQLGLDSHQVSGFVQGHVHPVQVNMAKLAAKEAIPEPPMPDSDKRQADIDKIIADGRKVGHAFVQIADDINRDVGGNWLPNDVHRRMMEMKG